MSWLNYITLNCVAPLPDLHLISDAGAGKGLMQFHPTRDTELIACGRANTPLNGEYLPSPVLGNGSVTPAILVHGLFRALQKKGFKIRVHAYQLGLGNTPDFSGCELDDVVVHSCAEGDEATLVREKLIPELRREAECGEQHLIAESGIGGTTFATLWLRRWLDEKLWFAGSTKEPDKLTAKSQVLDSLWDRSCKLGTDVRAYTESRYCSDPVQRACCALLEPDLDSLNLAGGAMLFAPVIAMNGSSQTDQISVATTKWVLDSQDSQIAAEALPGNCRLSVPGTDFLQSEFEAIRMYEKGYVIEGCGLGACLVFAEENGLSQEQIINSLDECVSGWLEKN